MIEYKTMRLTPCQKNIEKELQEYLNDCARLGWKLISVVRSDVDKYDYTWQRIMPQESYLTIWSVEN